MTLANALFVLVALAIVVPIMWRTIATHVRHTRLTARMEAYGVWVREQTVKLDAGKLSEPEKRELFEFTHRCLTSRGLWDYRGPWERPST